jgi:hypothetical protein
VLFGASTVMAAYVVGGTAWLWWAFGYDGEMLAIAAVTIAAMVVQWEVTRGS